MPQHIIDPDNLGNPGGPISRRASKTARNFGYIPDLSFCKPGDLILSREKQPSTTSRWITHTQTHAGFADVDSCWTHAAVFLYEDLVVEAVPCRRVRSRSLYEDIPGSILRVRRSPLAMIPADEIEITRYKIALRALGMLGARYSHWAAAKLGWQLISDAASYLSFGSTVICSKVFYDAFAEITLKGLKGCSFSTPVMPAHLSETQTWWISKCLG